MSHEQKVFPVTFGQLRYAGYKFKLLAIRNHVYCVTILMQSFDEKVTLLTTSTNVIVYGKI